MKQQVQENDNFNPFNGNHGTFNPFKSKEDNGYNRINASSGQINPLD